MESAYFPRRILTAKAPINQIDSRQFAFIYVLYIEPGHGDVLKKHDMPGYATPVRLSKDMQAFVFSGLHRHEDDDTENAFFVKQKV